MKSFNRGFSKSSDRSDAYLAGLTACFIDFVTLREENECGRCTADVFLNYLLDILCFIRGLSVETGKEKDEWEERA